MKAKEFLKKHWKKVVIGVSATGAAVTAYIFGYKAGSDSVRQAMHFMMEKIVPGEHGVTKFTDASLIVYSAKDAIGRDIDEEIFTEIAPDIETAILNADLESTVIDKTFDLGDGIQKAFQATIKKV